MSVHSIQRKRRRDPTRIRYKSLGCHEEFLTRICRTLYYAHLPSTERLSLPITEVAAELFSEVKSGRSLDRLGLEEASGISRNACVSPASLVLALLYLERLKISAPEYLDRVSSTQLFLVSSLVASKFLNDDGEDNEVLNSEWAVSADISLTQLNKLEKDFLAAINWEVYVESDEFWRRLEMLEEEIALRQATKRGFFTYSDLLALLGYIDSLSLAHTLLSVSAVCLTAYAAGVVSMVGSTALVSTLQRTASSLTSLQQPSPITTIDSNQSLSPHITTDDIASDCWLNSSNVDSILLSLCCQASCPPFSSEEDNAVSLSATLEDIGWERTNFSGGCDRPNQSSCYDQLNEFESSNYWWLKDEPIGGLLPHYILGSVVKPFYSYVQLVATH